MSEFGFCAKLDLFLTLLREQAISHLRIEEVVEILGDSNECLVAKALSALEVPGAVLLVERHVENHSIFSASLGPGMSPAGWALADRSISSNLQR